MDKIINYSKRAVLENYANFTGRDNRPQFWWFVLGVFIVNFGLWIMSNVPLFGLLFGLLNFVVSIGLLIPSIAATTRRLHDTGRSGWWQLIGLVPIVGVIVLIVLCAQPGQVQSNSYGPPPGPDALSGSSVGSGPEAGYPPPPPPPPA
jgi:uncharacterized membrane protein YhaH (DUF805 family)